MNQLVVWIRLCKKKFVNLTKEFNKKYNATVIISSHTLSEVYDLCDEIIFLKNGETVKEIVSSNINEKELEKMFESLYTDQLNINLPTGEEDKNNVNK